MFTESKARFNLYETLITSRMVESVCNIVLSLIATEHDTCSRSSTHGFKLSQGVINI